MPEDIFKQTSFLRKTLLTYGSIYFFFLEAIKLFLELEKFYGYKTLKEISRGWLQSTPVRYNES